MASFRDAVIGSTIAFLVSACPHAWAYSFAGGAGVPDNPYQIATAEQLLSLGADPNLQDKCFRLVASIDLAGRRGSQPLIPSFGGTLDGGGYKIENLTLFGMGAQALFGQLRAGAVVRNLGLTGLDVTGTASVGGLAAENAGTVLNCFSTGAVTSTGAGAGGLIAFNTGVVTNSYSNVKTTAYEPVGGLVADNAGTVSNCHSGGAVVGMSGLGLPMPGGSHIVSGNMAGGLVGLNTGCIGASYSGSAVLGGDYVGGLVGDNLARISSCYAIGTVIGWDHVGGLAGRSALGQALMVSCYSVAGVTSLSEPIGGLVGLSSRERIRNCFFLAPSDGGGPNNWLGTLLTRTQMQDRSSYTGWDFWGTDADGSENLWFLPGGAFPVLAWQTEITQLVAVPDVTGLSLSQAQAELTAVGLTGEMTGQDYHRTIASGNVIGASPRAVAAPGARVGLILSLGKAYDWTQNPGDGTPANPYRLQTPGQLESLGDNPPLWDKCFILTADLDLSGRVYAAALIAPDVDEATPYFQGSTFTGSFNGNGHTILNLRITNTAASYLGLFGTIGTTGQVSGLTLKNVDITGNAYVGALAGRSTGTATDCSATGQLTGGCTALGLDGLIGSNQGTMTNCRSDLALIRDCATRRP